MTWFECSNSNQYNPPTIFKTLVLFLFSIVDLTFLPMFFGVFFPTLYDVLYQNRPKK